LFGAGWTLDEVLDLTWEQMQTCITCVVKVQAEKAELIFGAIGQALGAKPKSGKTGKSVSNSKKNKKKKTTLEDKFRKAGVQIQTE
jgi:hypothetical protein